MTFRGRIAKLLINALALLLAAFLIPGVSVTSFALAILIALIIAVTNVTLRPILLFLTFPITFMTLGLFTLIIDAFLLWLISALISGFLIGDFPTAVLVAIVVTVMSFLGDQFIEALED